MRNEMNNCSYCGLPIKNLHGNCRYHKNCSYAVKKERSKRQYETISMNADSLWLNEKILRKFYYYFGPDHEIDPSDLTSKGFTPKNFLFEKVIKGKTIYFMRHFGFQLLKNKKISICKL